LNKSRTSVVASGILRSEAAMTLRGAWGWGLMTFGFGCSTAGPSIAAQMVPSDGSAGSEAATGVEIQIDDDPAALTSAPRDSAFRLTLIKSLESYMLTDVKVIVEVPKTLPVATPLELIDNNMNGVLDPGDALACKEPGVNYFDATIVNQPVTVIFNKQVNGAGMSMELARAVWLPAN
jgi:hypothetical protein